MKIKIRYLVFLVLFFIPRAAESLQVNMESRQDVIRFFTSYYLPYVKAPIQWTGGSLDACVPGTPGQPFRDAGVNLVNFMRALAGLPEVVVQDDFNIKAQDAALIMAANRQISHFPDSTWKCYTADGATGAAGAELSAGFNDASVIDGFMDDSGNSNAAVSHRRQILNPAQRWIGVGAVNTYIALYMGYAANLGPRPDTPNGVSWPPAGFMPWQVMPNISNRWSFSFLNADFSNAVVTMSKNNESISVNVISRDGSNYYGENGIIWVPQDVLTGVAAADTKFTVTISNVIVSGSSRTFTYSVTIIDPLLESFMTTLYQDVLGWTPSDSDVALWSAYLRSDKRIDRVRTVVHDFFALQDKYRPLTVWQYVWYLYDSLLGRAPTAEDQGAWVNALLAYYNTMIPTFTDGEFSVHLQNVGVGGVINNLYIALRSTAPSQVEFDGWYNWVSATNDYIGMAIGFTNSLEYLTMPRSTVEHSKWLYRGILGREASPDEAAAWSKAFLALRALIEDGFVDSSEFKNRYNSFLN